MSVEAEGRTPGAQKRLLKRQNSPGSRDPISGSRARASYSDLVDRFNCCPGRKGSSTVPEGPWQSQRPPRTSTSGPASQKAFSLLSPEEGFKLKQLWEYRKPP